MCKQCDICGTDVGIIRNVKKHNMSLCEKHRQQFKLHGKIIDNRPPKAKITTNEIIIKDQYAEIVLYDKFNYPKNKAIIDIEDVEKCSNIKWFVKDSDYICGIINNKRIYLHRHVMNTVDRNFVVDHINHNRLDNRKDNLRICSSSENNMNKRQMTNNTSGIKGVHWDNKNNKWVASITKNKQYYFLGRFDTLKEAAEIRGNAEENMFKEFKYTKDCDYIYAN